MFKRLFVMLLLVTPLAAAQGWPSEVKEIRIRSTKDHTDQPAMWWTPPDSKEAPLLVGLHTWSGDHKQTSSAYWRWCRQQGWHFIFPNFRGPNRTPEALASDLAVQDIVDAVAWAKTTVKVNPRRVYLIGFSGGAHMAMVMAGRHPEIWAGVSAWCGIFDLSRWYTEHVRNGKPDNYALQFEQAMGGPLDTPARKAEARRRSPIGWLQNAGSVPLHIAAGVHDGRKGAVRFRHSLDAFNAVVPPAARIPDALIDSFYATQQLPVGVAAAAADPLYGARKPLYQRTHDNTRVTIFDGAHQILQEIGLNWLALQEKGRPAVWEITNPIQLRVLDKETKAGR